MQERKERKNSKVERKKERMLNEFKSRNKERINSKVERKRNERKRNRRKIDDER